MLLAVAAPAAADELRSPADLDGWYLTLGPLGAATRVQGGWFSGAGGEVSVVHLVEKNVPALLGICAGGMGYGGRPGGRLWLEGELAVSRPLPFAVGLGVGPVAEVDRVRPPRLGAQATLWIFAVIVPYVRAGYLAETGGYLETGVMLKMPVRFAY